MASKRMNREQAVAYLKRMQGSKTLREFASELGISAPFLLDIYKGNREMGPKILSAAGLREIKLYEAVAA